MLNSNKNQNRQAALAKINKISFAIDELRLFLDTHPRNRKALDLFNCYVKERNELINIYEQMYGPFSGYSINGCEEWDWNEAPMPWEGDC